MRLYVRSPADTAIGTVANLLFAALEVVISPVAVSPAVEDVVDCKC